MSAKAQAAKVAMAKPKKALDFGKFSGSAEKLNALKALDASKDAPDGEAELDLIDRSPQVRQKFDEAKLQELAEDIKDNGLLQPILLKKKSDGRYHLVAGERRYRAAALAGMAKVPFRLVPDDIDDFAIRRMQISENEQREPLTAYERAQGVAEDVEKYGTEGACKIWGKKAPWISKRLTALRLPVPILALFRDEIINDLEMLNSLNNIFMLDEKEFSAVVGDIEAGIAEGIPANNIYSREQLRDKETLIKERLQRLSEKETGAAKSTRPTAKTMAPAAAAARKTSDLNKPTKSADTNTVSGPVKSSGEVSATDRGSLVQDADQGQGRAAHAPNETAKSSGPSRESLQRRLSLLREQIYEWGLENQKQFMRIQEVFDSLSDQGESTEQLEDWVKWAGFQSIVLPLVAVLGDKASDIFLRRLASELKKEGAGPLWDALHPLRDPAGSSDGERDKTPAMPDGWRF